MVQYGCYSPTVKSLLWSGKYSPSVFFLSVRKNKSKKIKLKKGSLSYSAILLGSICTSFRAHVLAAELSGKESS